MSAADLDLALLSRLQKRKARTAADAIAPVTIVKVRPTFEKGRYISPGLTGLIKLVARHADVAPESIRGGGRITRLVNARFAIANLAAEFCPRLSARAVDDGMLRGEGSCLWARGHHADRLHQYEDYAALFERCRVELLERAP